MMKPANKVKQNNTAEPVERRVSTERNSYTPPEAETQCLAEPEEGLARIRAAARKDGTLRFNNLLHHITVERLWKAYDGLKKRAVAGVDGVTWYQYGENLLPNLIELHKRIQTDRYQAQPVKRGWISKGDGSKRPLGITCVEDKIVQQAVVWILEQIVEQDFLGFSYGSRLNGDNTMRWTPSTWPSASRKSATYLMLISRDTTTILTNPGSYDYWNIG